MDSHCAHSHRLMDKSFIFRPISLVEYLLFLPQRLFWLKSNGEFAHNHLVCTQTTVSSPGKLNPQKTKIKRAQGSSSAICSHFMSAGITPSSRVARQRSSEGPRSTTANRGALENQDRNFLCMALLLEVFYYLKEKTNLELKVNSHSHLTQLPNVLWNSPQVSGEQTCSAIAASVGQL